jgi:hypothetical protein
VFDAEGRVIDDTTRDRIKTLIEGFAAFADSHRG